MQPNTKTSKAAKTGKVTQPTKPTQAAGAKQPKRPAAQRKVCAPSDAQTHHASRLRPQLAGGHRVNVYLDDASVEFASTMGGGNVSQGIRIALRTMAVNKRKD